MMVVIPGLPEDLPFEPPVKSCCNCGTSRNLEMVNTEFKRTRYLLIGGTEMTYTLYLPYCQGCKRSANRLRQGWFSKSLVAFAVFWVMVLAIGVSAPDRQPRWMRDSPFRVAGVAALALTSAFYLTRRAAPPRTSYYQPVFLRKAPASSEGVALGFTNDRYATQFELANKWFCDSGALVVEKC